MRIRIKINVYDKDNSFKNSNYCNLEWIAEHQINKKPIIVYLTS